MNADARPAENSHTQMPSMPMRPRHAKTLQRDLESESEMPTSAWIKEPLRADDIVHQSPGDRLLHGRHSELALGVLGVKDHRSPADTYDFRGIRSALSTSRPLQAGRLALGQAWAKRRNGRCRCVAQLRVQVDRNEMQLMLVLPDSGV